MLGAPGCLLRVLGCGERAWVRSSRVVARRPVRVHLKGPQQEAQQVIREYEDMQAAASRKGQKSKHSEQAPPAVDPDPNPDKLLRNRIHFKLLSGAGSYERKLLENMKHPKYRSEHQLFVAEGHRIIREALEHGATPAALYFTRLGLVAALKAPPSELKLEHVIALNDLPLFKAPYKTLQMWSSVTTSPGIVGVFKIPTIEPTTTTTISPPLTLVLDELREPGNLGGVLRTAAAVGVHQVLLMKGCCDPWDVKVVRAGCGAHFRLRIHTKLTWDSIMNCVPESAKIFLADVHRGEDAEDMLGVAGEEEEDGAAIKQRKINIRRDSSEDNVYELDIEGNKVMVDNSYSDPEHLELYKNVPLRTVRYDQLGLGGSDGGAVLVVGGEVGVSNAAKKFVSDNCGTKVTVPLANGMDSLNVGVASGVVLYEMQKQLHNITSKKLQEKYESGG
ncbi:rRNA methyltransferase 3, mitochondrial-like isoform X2 [Portunus trituberculatus]|uniref:rRNA methyltransferase 3, mitochondrial-like isoform X2 n=1 Tax=Portunus trituberculatus TaxID=210409 RepID=UPI001E1D1526|nr:rRNA methyltransferase 3, mitochondrial-like isoform X2 [Portunus trituberculatus]